jgi:hypothetical protein
VELELIEEKPQKWDNQSDAYKTGIEFLFRNNLLTTFGDFVLQDQSPIYDEKNSRPKMGTTSSGYGSSVSKPNFTSLLKLIVIMVGDL